MVKELPDTIEFRHTITRSFVRYTLCSEKNTHSYFLSYLHE